MLRGIVIFGALSIAAPALAAGQDTAAAAPSVHVEPAHLDGPRALASQTEQGAIRDYLESWNAMRGRWNRISPAF